MKKLAVRASAAFLIAAAGFAYVMLFAPNRYEGDRFIIVSKGESFAAVADSLDHAGVLTSRRLFVLAARILDLDTRMQIGKYRITGGMSNRDILLDLRSGRTIEMVPVTIPEGLQAVRQARLLHKNLGIDSTRYLRLVNDTAFARSLGVDGSSLEGYLMPNTYRFYWQTDEAEVIRALVMQFWSVFDDTLMELARRRGATLNDVLTIASIVEGETRIDTERAIVAGVYYNRLRKKIRLQADPTIQYLIEPGPRPLRFIDLQIESPYNTYRHAGLPPGPVNNPGRAAILAALHPARHRYLYFVANGRGGHVFTRSFSEHKRAVKRYRRMREAAEAGREEAEPEQK